MCDGTNGTPDLRNRFIYGGDGSNNGATGGEASHKLTTSEMPMDYVVGLKSTQEHGVDPTAGCYSSASASYHGRVIIGDEINSRGDNQPHNNMPPYYVLAYIMKL